MTLPSNSPPAPACIPKGMHPGYGGHFIWLMLAGLLTYTAWVWAGLRTSFHNVAVLAALAGLAGLFASGGRAGRSALWRDPFFWLGLAFLAYLTLQWANAGRVGYYDVAYRRWTFAPPRWPAWPSAFSRPDARQMLDWFFPAWVAVLAVRSPLLTPRALQRLLRLVAYSAGLLALFGVIQFLSRTRSIYWIRPLEGAFFASFAYANHAAAYFILTGALSAGLLYREILRGGRTPNRRRAILLGGALMLCLTAANLSLSRAGIILAWTLGVFAAAFGLGRGWRVLNPVGRSRLVVITAGTSLLFFFAVSGFGAKAIRHEFAVAAAQEDPPLPALAGVNLSISDRPLFARAALAMWREHPWQGVGGWGFKRLAASYLPPEQWNKIARRGWANVHLDALQFLVEFGAIGFGLLLGAAAAPVAAALRPAGRVQPLWVMSLAGLGLVLVFSLIDLPFRCPAILYAWAVILAALPKACSSHSSTGPETLRS